MQIINLVAYLTGERNFGFAAAVRWPDLTLHPMDAAGNIDTDGAVRVTYFGGTREQDPTDNGETACGERTRNEDGTENHIDGCSLPCDGSDVPETAGSPIHRLPCGWPVTFYNPDNGEEAEVPCYDRGPAFGTNNAADLMRKTSMALAKSVRPNTLNLHVRIKGGATHLPPVLLAQLREQGLIPGFPK